MKTELLLTVEFSKSQWQVFECGHICFVWLQVLISIISPYIYGRRCCLTYLKSCYGFNNLPAPQLMLGSMICKRRRNSCSRRRKFSKFNCHSFTNILKIDVQSKKCKCRSCSELHFLRKLPNFSAKIVTFFRKKH